MGSIGDEDKTKTSCMALISSDMIASEKYDVDISVDRKVQG